MIGFGVSTGVGRRADYFSTTFFILERLAGGIFLPAGAGIVSADLSVGKFFGCLDEIDLRDGWYPERHTGAAVEKASAVALAITLLVVAGPQPTMKF